MKKNKKVWMRGNSTRSKEVITKLTELGGQNTGFIEGNRPDWIYFIDDKDRIDGVKNRTGFAKSIIKDYQEIKLDDELDDETVPVSQDYRLNIQNGLNTFQRNCISIPKGTSVKICNEDGKMMIIVEPKEVKHEFKKGDVMFLEVKGDNKIYQHIAIVKSADKDSIHFYVGLCVNDNELTLPKSDAWFSNADIKSIRFATEEEKRSLFLAMLNKGMFWDENKMKVRTLKDGDIITIKSDIGEYWQSIFKEIKDGKVYSYSDLDCDKKLYKGPFGEVNAILSIRYSTTEERQTLFDKIEEQKHKKWNAETKEFEDIRWRAKTGEQYWFINADGRACSMIDYNINVDNNIHSFGNYFQTKELAEAAADKIKELLSKL